METKETKSSKEVVAITKYVRMSPSKARDLTRSIQGLPVAEAMGLTSVSRRKAAVLVGQTLKSALANAANNAGLDPDRLYVKEAVIQDGPRMKRHWPRARGMVSPIQRRLCHVRIVLSERATSNRKRGR